MAVLLHNLYEMHKRGEALDWWSHNVALFTTFNEAVEDMYILAI